MQVYSLDFFPSKKDSRIRYHVPKRVSNLSLVPSISDSGGLVIVGLRKECEMEKVVEKISLSKCKSVLEKDGSKYSNEEILEIREFLYKMADLDYEVFLKQKIRDKEFEEAKQKPEDEDLKQAA